MMKGIQKEKKKLEQSKKERLNWQVQKVKTLLNQWRNLTLRNTIKITRQPIQFSNRLPRSSMTFVKVTCSILLCNWIQTFCNFLIRKWKPTLFQMISKLGFIVTCYQKWHTNKRKKHSINLRKRMTNKIVIQKPKFQIKWIIWKIFIISSMASRQNFKLKTIRMISFLNIAAKIHFVKV